MKYRLQPHPYILLFVNLTIKKRRYIASCYEDVWWNGVIAPPHTPAPVSIG
jgi:hypothetical protein